MTDTSAAVWRKSSRSNASGDCVEVATNLGPVVAVRDSKDPHGPVLTVAAGSFRTLLRAARAGALEPASR